MSGPAAAGGSAAGFDYYAAVPYLLVVESVERSGQWLRRAAYPELPGCAVEAPSALEALDRIEHERTRVLRSLWERGEPIPVPRPPLRAGRPALPPPGPDPRSTR
jgi:predicted RNase H-like HicB family nuclease